MDTQGKAVKRQLITPTASPTASRPRSPPHGLVADFCRMAHSLAAALALRALALRALARHFRRLAVCRAASPPPLVLERHGASKREA